MAVKSGLRLLKCGLALFLLAGLSSSGCIKQKSASRSYGIEDRDNLDPETQRKIAEACAPSDETGLLDPDTEGQFKADCTAMHSLALNLEGGRNGKVKVNVHRRQSQFEEFLPSAEVGTLLNEMKEAAGSPSDTSAFRFFGCRITPSLGDPNTLLGQNGTGTGNPKDCTSFATDPNWGTTILGDVRQFEFVFVRGADGKLYQVIRVTGNWQELSAIFIRRKPLARSVMVTHRPDSWANQITFPAPLPSDRFFEGQEGSDEQSIAKQMLGIPEEEKGPLDLEEFSKVWLKQQVDGARKVVVAVGAAVVLSAASLPALGAAMGSMWTATTGTIGYFTAGASSAAATAAGITSAGSAATVMASSAFAVAIAAGGVFTAVSIPLNRWIDDLPMSPLKVAMQTAYYTMIAADVYNLARKGIFHTAKALGTGRSVLGHVLKPQSWKNLLNIVPKSGVSKQEIIAQLNSRGGPAWERFKLAMNGLRNSAVQMKNTKLSAPRALPADLQAELKSLLQPATGGGSKAADIASRVKISQMLEEQFVKARLTDLERSIITAGLGSYVSVRPL
ncbi:MAG: hypothetical protein EBR09_04235 [Proteobacteria bacterium]|nr:hypothetical protein [Pseudomonadota bacterium]